MVHFSRSVQQHKQPTLYNEQTNHLHACKCLLTNRLHGKAAELCLFNSCNNSITLTKYIEYITSIHSMRYSFYHVCW